jgi:hypothetical protein
MKRLLIVAFASVSLAGCATQFGTRIPKPAPHPVMHVKAAPTPVIVAPAPSVVLPSAPQEAATFKQRFRKTFGKIKWLHSK